MTSYIVFGILEKLPVTKDHRATAKSVGPFNNKAPIIDQYFHNENLNQT